MDQDGIKPDPLKVQAIKQMKEPGNITELRRYLGMVNQLRKFSPQMSDIMKPMNDLLSTKNDWTWGQCQSEAFNKIKEELCSSQVLTPYEVDRETLVSADASYYGLGAVIRQKSAEGMWKPIAYISRSLTETEQRYAQIEKEALAFTWACERFEDYLIGKKFKIETDHKPLVPLFSTKELSELPIRIQRFRMCMMQFHFTIIHVPGKNLVMADALSKAPVDNRSMDGTSIQKEAEAYVHLIMSSMPVTEKRLTDIHVSQDKDEICLQVKKYVHSGWPHQSRITGDLKKYFQVRNLLNIQNGLLLQGSRIVIPRSMQNDILEKIHSGHQGITRCTDRAKQTVWWPSIERQVREKIERCLVCSQHRHQSPEPLIPSSFPDYPFQRAATDLFQWKGVTYLLVVDYYSRFSEIAKLKTTTSSEVIHHLKSIFCRHGIPEEVISDNGPQYSGTLFSEFASKYSFKHTASSPKFPQSNGEAERPVKTVKQMLEKCEDPYLGLLSYRSTPLNNGYSPAELIMGRKF